LKDAQKALYFSQPRNELANARPLGSDVVPTLVAMRKGEWNGSVRSRMASTIYDRQENEIPDLEASNGTNFVRRHEKTIRCHQSGSPAA